MRKEGLDAMRYDDDCSVDGEDWLAGIERLPAGMNAVPPAEAEPPPREAVRPREGDDALRRLRAHFELALDATGTSAFELDLGAGTVVSTSGLYRALGYEPADQARTIDGVSSLVHPEDLAALRETVSRHVAGKSPRFSAEFRVRSARGAWVWLSALGQAAERDEWGLGWQIVGISQDVSERKNAEEERRAADRGLQQQQSLDSLGVLAGGLAHQFNNLLQQIQGHAELALMSQDVGASTRANLQRVVSASQSAARLTRQMLAYAGKNVMARRAPVDLHALVDDFLESWEGLAKGIHVRLLGEPGPSTTVCGDRDLLEQMVTAVVTNAEESMDGGGEIRVEVRGPASQETVPRRPEGGESHPRGGWVEVVVADTGHGMDDHTLERVFEPFFTTRFLGRGLGMAAVLGIVKAHEGIIHLESSPGEGTTVTIRLPAWESSRRSMLCGPLAV